MLMAPKNVVRRAGSRAHAESVTAITQQAQTQGQVMPNLSPKQQGQTTTPLQGQSKPDSDPKTQGLQPAGHPQQQVKDIGGTTALRRDLCQKLKAARQNARGKCQRGRDVEHVTTDTMNPRYQAMMQKMSQGCVSRTIRAQVATGRYTNVIYSSGADSTPRENCGEAKNPGPQWVIKGKSPKPNPGSKWVVKDGSPKPNPKPNPKAGPNGTNPAKPTIQPKPKAGPPQIPAKQQAQPGAAKPQPHPKAASGVGKPKPKAAPKPQPAKAKSAQPYKREMGQMYMHWEPMFAVEPKHMKNNFPSAVRAMGFAKQGFDEAVAQFLNLQPTYHTMFSEMAPPDMVEEMTTAQTYYAPDRTTHPQHLLDFLTFRPDTMSHKFNIVVAMYQPESREAGDEAHQVEVDKGLIGYITLMAKQGLYKRDRPNLVCVMPHNDDTAREGYVWIPVHNFKQQAVVTKTFLGGKAYRRPVKVGDEWNQYITASPMLEEPDWATHDLEEIQLQQFDARMQIMVEEQEKHHSIQLNFLEAMERVLRNKVRCQEFVERRQKEDRDGDEGGDSGQWPSASPAYQGLFPNSSSDAGATSWVVGALLCPESIQHYRDSVTTRLLTMAMKYAAPAVLATWQRWKNVRQILSKAALQCMRMIAQMLKRVKTITPARAAKMLLLLIVSSYLCRLVRIYMQVQAQNPMAGLKTKLLLTVKQQWNPPPQTPPHAVIQAMPPAAPQVPKTKPPATMIRGAHPLHGQTARLNTSQVVARITDPTCWQNVTTTRCECMNYPMCKHAAMPRVVDGYPMLGELIMSPALVSRFDPLGFRDNEMAGSQVTVTEHVGAVSGWTVPLSPGVRLLSRMHLVTPELTQGVVRPVESRVMDGTRYVMYPGLAEVLRPEYYMRLATGTMQIMGLMTIIAIAVRMATTTVGRQHIAMNAKWVMIPGVQMVQVAIAVLMEVLGILGLSHPSYRTGLKGFFIIKTLINLERVTMQLDRVMEYTKPTPLLNVLCSGRWTYVAAAMVAYVVVRGYAVILARKKVEEIVTFYSSVPDLVTCADALAGLMPTADNQRGIRHAVRTTILQQQGPAVLAQRMARLCNAAEMDPGTYRKVADLTTLIERAQEAIETESATAEVVSTPRHQGGCNADRDTRKLKAKGPVFRSKM